MPFELVMETVPLNPEIVVNVILVLVLVIILEKTFVPPTVNAVAPLRFVPVIVTVLPTYPLVPLPGESEKLDIIGAGVTITAPETLLVVLVQVPVTTQ